MTAPTIALPRKPRIAIAGIHIESSTFTPYTSTAADFHVTRGPEIMERYFWRNYTWATQVDWLPILHARALPGGVLAAADYNAWKAEILTTLTRLHTEAPLDGLFFDIHGAMSVTGLDDAEGDLISAIRAIIGSAPLVSASMDLHGNVSPALFAGCDLLTCYRLAPHEDTLESRMRAAAVLVDRLLAGTGKPAKALIHVPILLPGEMTSTRLEPAKSLYAQLPWIAARPGIIDAAIWIGFAWADQPRCTGAVVVTGDDAPAVASAAKEIAQSFWDVRKQFEFVAPTGSFTACLDAADNGIAAGRTPFFISDSGDNPGAGGADDVTVALAELLSWQPSSAQQRETSAKNQLPYAIYASIFDPEVALAAVTAGAGSHVAVRLGGKIDTRAPGPLALTAEVRATAVDPLGGNCAVLRVLTAGATIDIIVTENRNQYGDIAKYELLHLNPAAADLVVVKIGYLEPEIYALAADWRLALTPGGVDQDLLRLNHQHLPRPLFPFDPDMADPTWEVQLWQP